MKQPPKPDTAEPNRFPYKILAAIVVVVVLVVAVVIVTQMNAPKPAGFSQDTDSSTGEGLLFATALMQMGTAKAQGTPMESSNPLVLTAKVIGEPSATPPAK